MAHAQYTVTFQNEKAIAIIDNYNDGSLNKTITNDPEHVISRLNPKPGTRVIYKDTDGNWDELTHDGRGKFKGFCFIGGTELNAAAQKDWSHLMPNIDDDIDWDEWLSLSETEMEAELQSAMRQYAEMIKEMTSAELYCFRRRRLLDFCLRYRKILRENPSWNFIEKNLRECQKRFIKYRLLHYHNIKIGEA